eukprot:GHRQ01028109.1.p2 GENE.GHRQ01028109.1~~GHRQ01028109.1.p2  ORF type:complete len:118 (-),score=7.41 GHRQ01028109.1:53-406(-)
MSVCILMPVPILLLCRPRNPQRMQPHTAAGAAHLVARLVVVVELEALEVDAQHVRQRLDRGALDGRHAPAQLLAEVGVVALHELTLQGMQNSKSSTKQHRGSTVHNSSTTVHGCGQR